MDSPLDDEQLLAWFTLLRAPGVGCQTLKPLLDSADAVSLMRRPPAHCPDKLRNYLSAPDLAGAEKDLAWLQQTNNHFITIKDRGYPPLLKELPDAPVALFAHGNPQLLSLPQIAMVGSRNPSHGGKSTGHEFARFLADAGLIITSGLAQGIDTQAHKGALDGNGKTIAVTGTGLDRVYPAANRALAHEIAKNGCLVSEYSPGTPPTPSNFPRRNRIISGLSAGTLVVEATVKSGSLITARLAAEQGREVFAIPGSIHNPMARGCHALIRQGAKLVETAEHIVEELASLLNDTPAHDQQPIANNAENVEKDPDHQKLLDAMGYDPVTTDQLVTRTGFSAGMISSMLLLLELQGDVLSETGGVFTRLGN